MNRPPSIMAQRSGNKPRRRDPQSMTASAVVLSSGANPSVKLSSEQWQSLAWDMYDEVGELRFGVNWVANALSRVNLVAAVPPKSQGDEPLPIDLEKLPNMTQVVGMVSEIAGGVAGQGQLLAAAARQLTVPGVGYIIAHVDAVTDAYGKWRCYSNEEVRRQAGSSTIEYMDPDTGAWRACDERDIIVKVARSHPRKSWMPDSPVRSVLSVLTEIVRLSQRIQVTAASRLAANGLLVMPMEVDFPLGQGVTAPGEAATDEDGGQSLTAEMLAVAGVAMQDPSHVAARVPLGIRVPGEFVDKVRHIPFDTGLDKNADSMRTSAVKRLALGLDMPPEVLMGMGGTNHWSAWQISEEVITLQIEPLAELICHALTEGWLKPALRGAQLDENSAVVWYDTTDLTTRPDRSEAASEAHDRLKLSDSAYLRELGLDVSDMPDDEELRKRLLVKVALGAPTQAAAMLAAAGYLPQQVADAAAEAAGAAPASDAAPADEPAADLPAERALPSRAALIATCADHAVYRALEVAGRRLRGAAGKGRPGGTESVPCDDPTTLHTTLAATNYAPLDALLAGAWDRADVLAERLDLDPAAFVSCLDSYTRTLLAVGRPHEFDALTAALSPLVD